MKVQRSFHFLLVALVIMLGAAPSQAARLSSRSRFLPGIAVPDLNRIRNELFDTIENIMEDVVEDVMESFISPETSLPSKPGLPPLSMPVVVAEQPDCFCSREYAPVCAVLPTLGGERLEKTFNNECEASCVGGAVVVSQGKCEPDKPEPEPEPEQPECFCSREYAPVCAVLPTLGGERLEQTFNNECEASCVGGAVVVSQGICEPDKPEPEPEQPECFCSREYAPVCAVLPTLGGERLEKTFNNECEASCVGGAVVISKGECTKENKEMCDFVCPANSFPKPNRKCMDSFADCKCNNGFFKQNGRCIRKKKEEPTACSCTREYAPVCATVYDFLGRPSREMFGNKCLALCEGGSLITNGKCTSEVANPCNYICPANSTPKPNRQCMDSFADCKCNSGFVKRDGNCVEQYNCFTRESWSFEKKQYCCKFKGIGCFSSTRRLRGSS